MPGSTISFTTIVTQSPELVGSTVEGQVVLMSINNGSYYGLDSVGSRVWELIAQPSSVANLCDRLLGEYEVARSDCEQQVLDLLRKLAASNLIRVVDEPSQQVP